MDATELLDAYAAGRRCFEDICLVGADLSGAYLAGIVLRRSNLAGAQLCGADLTGADLIGATLHDARLSLANMKDVRCGSADLSGADLLRANLSGAELSRASLNRANLTAATLHKANLSCADLRNADLRETDLSNACLIDATLVKANLKRACLVDANCCGADLSFATVYDADFSGADLTGIRQTSVKGRLDNHAPRRRRAAPVAFYPTKTPSESRDPEDAKRVVARAINWVMRWTCFVALGGAWLGAVRGSRFDLQTPELYAMYGAIMGAAAGLIIGATSAIRMAKRFQQAPDAPPREPTEIG